ncbi:hypothetical protein [Dactylosporangium sp. NPDC000521]|uniref:hypothetical protein n=1 Tax=Dactylosporangium sp. NPDC000521 TaxID=3363975 RepID=UPI0036BE8AD4
MDAISTAAGAVADPKTGLSRAKTRLLSPRTALLASCVLAAYLIGRGAVRHKAH